MIHGIIACARRAREIEKSGKEAMFQFLGSGGKFPHNRLLLCMAIYNYRTPVPQQLCR